MTTRWRAADLGNAMRRIGWLAIVALLGLEIDGHQVLRGPLALAVAVAAWSMGEASPNEPTRRLLRATTSAAVLVAIASIAPWFGADREGAALAAAIASLAGGAAYCRAMSRWVAGPGVDWVTGRFRLAAGVQAVVGAAVLAYVALVVALGSPATPVPLDRSFQVGGEQYDFSIVFGRSLGSGVASTWAEVVLVVVLLVGGVGFYLMATANKTAQRSLRGGAIVDAALTTPGSDGAATATADGEPGEAVTS